MDGQVMMSVDSLSDDTPERLSHLEEGDVNIVDHIWKKIFETQSDQLCFIFGVCLIMLFFVHWLFISMCMCHWLLYLTMCMCHWLLYLILCVGLSLFVLFESFAYQYDIWLLLYFVLLLSGS